MSRTDAQHSHRFSPVLKAMLQEAAKVNNRSLTAEVNARLEQSFTCENPTGLVAGEASTLPAILSIDSKLDALCHHLGVKPDRQ